MSQQFSVLFVDDEPRILDGLRRQLRASRLDWDMRFVDSGEGAIRAMNESPADVVVSDMRMPGMNGAQVLRRVQQSWPDALRVILSGQTDQAELLGDIGAVHQFLQKPCDPDAVRTTILRAQTVRKLLESRRLRKVSAGVVSLPLLASTHTMLAKALDADASLTAIAEIVDRDMALKTKLIQLVNTSFFGMPRRISTAKDAVSLLGTRNLRAIAVTAHAFDCLAADDACSHVISSLWAASLRIGATAESLARKAGQSQTVVEQSLLAGTLSLIGRALLARYEPLNLLAACKLADSGVKLHKAEASACGAPQQHVGGYALGLWAFNDAIVEAVTFQDDPFKSSVNEAAHPLTYVHAARSLNPVSRYVEAIEPCEDFLVTRGLEWSRLRRERHAA